MTVAAKRLSIAESLGALRAKKQLALMPFVPSGYPNLDATKALLPALEQAGASIVEVGLPFSDPIADGPIIQEAFAAALGKRLKMSDTFRAVAEARKSVSIPLVAMGSYSIVYRYGLDRFIKSAKDSGFDGLILPDLPPPEAECVCRKVNAAGLDTILLVAPTTTRERRIEIARLTTGFIYYLSVSGITGERSSLPQDLAANLKDLKSLTDRPVCVGFGISKPEHLKQLEGHADGAIVGTAVVRRIKEHATQTPQQIAESVASYCRDLLKLVR